MKSIKEEANLKNKKILLRLDLNVPLVGEKITDTTRIDKILPTLKFLISQNAKIIIISHVGRPKGKVLNELTLRPICKDLEINKSTRVNQLTDEQILKIREYIDNNFSGEGDLRRENSLSIKRLIDLATYRGSRHRKKLPVRGQRTRCNARTRKGKAIAIAGKKLTPLKK